MLAFFVVMLMLSWVIGDSLFTYFAGNRNPSASTRQNARAVAVSWDGGKLTNLQLADLVTRRQILNSFLEQIEVMGTRSAMEAGIEPQPLRVQILRGPTTPQQGVEKSVLQTRLLADKARAAGMRVGDDAIVQYLDELGRGNVTRTQMRDILSRMQSGRGRVTIDDIMASLREEMLARNYINSNQYAFETVTPEQRYRDWLRANDRVIVEAAAIPADKYLGDVKEPTDAELTASFEKYKDREASPELVYGTTELPSASPGFKIPRKIDLQFIEANYDAFLAKAEGKVTDDEIAKYYEAHKDPMFVKADTGIMEDNSAKKNSADGKAPPASDTKGKEGQTKPEAQKPAEPNSPAKPESEKKEGTAKPADSTAAPAKGEPKKEEAKKDEPKKEATPSADAPKKEAAPVPPAEPPKGDAKPAAGKQSSSSNGKPSKVFHLVAFAEDAKQATPPAAAPAADATKAPAAADKATAGNPPTTTPPPAPPSPPAPPAAPPEPPKENPAAAKATLPATAPATPAAPAGAPAAAKKPVQFQPLEEVKDVIRREIASGKVSEELSKLTGGIRDQLESDFQKWFSERLTALDQKKEVPAPPKSLADLAPLAEKNGLKAGKTGPLSLLQLRDLPIGKSSVADTGRTLMAQLFATKELDLFEPVQTVDIDGNRYVAMKTSDTPGKVPTLAEVRAEVVKAWKQQEAAKLAEKAADEMAKKAQDAKQPLPQFFADNPAIKVVRTDPFSELTGGDVGFANGQMQPTPFRLGQPDGIVAPGPEFMKKVFSLKNGDVGVVLNHDHTIAYVVRLVEHQMPVNELRTAYLGEVNTWPGIVNMTRGHMQDAWNTLQDDAVAGANVKWERDADKIEQADSNETGS